ncbi:MAG: bifunctional acetate--CoA ligase family protein/GNAT family N-acetyltransferase [Acidobacteriia bacterium]|nr:bifunctional acetate--CoA ligase family protein/GNAT family N-acetyltransferase [Terriglobia bacterium]
MAMTAITPGSAVPPPRPRPLSLEVFFRPRNVAVIGATDAPSSVGGALLWNLARSPFDGAIFPVNPNRTTALGLKCYPTIGEVPAPIDLAVVVTPAHTVPGIIGECGRAGVSGAIVISAGFKETGPAGAALEQRVLDEAAASGIRIIGPNCLGVMNPLNGLNATFANALARPGNVGFISQSGALCTAVLDWSLREMVGFSAFVSVGSMLDVGWGDLIQYLGDDPATQSIVVYMESVGDARSFLSAAREVALSKPIIVIKAGRSEAAAKAAASHTGALTGSDDVLDAAFRRCGVLRVNNISELFYLSEALAKQPRPTGPRLTIVSNAGGPGVLATDALLAEGGQLAELTDDTVEQMSRVLSPNWSHRNPVDILGDAGPQQYSRAIELASKDPNTDGMLVILAPQRVTDPTVIAEELKRYAKLEGKPVLASWMGGASVAAGESILNRAGIPTYAFPDSAARVFQAMWRYSDNLRALYETPAAVGLEIDPAGRDRVATILENVRHAHRGLLTEFESKQVLAAYGIPTVETQLATTEDEAAACATRIGYPAVVKLHSETITHKTDVGGVQLNLADASAVREAYRKIKAAVPTADFLGVTVQPMVKRDGYELILGSSIDQQFGPILLFGSGGQLVEVFKDRALALPPLNTTLARRLMERTRIVTALRGVRGRKSIDVDAIERLLVRFSYLVAEQPWIREIDINPLLASPDGLLALDARIVLHSREEDIAKLAIRPYPVQYVSPWQLEDGTQVVIRPVRPEDEPMIVKFHSTLSDRSVYLRYFHMMTLDCRVSHDRLRRTCFIDYDREIALVVERPSDVEPEIIAVGRLMRARHGNEAEFAILISDACQGQGIGTELMQRLLDVARAEKMERVTGDILPENSNMLRVCKQLGFKLKHVPGEGIVRADISVLIPPSSDAPGSHSTER